MTTMTNIMMAITQGVGPCIRPPGSRRRSAGVALIQSSIGAAHLRWRVPERSGGIDHRALVEADHMRPRRRRDQRYVVGGDDDRRAEPVERGQQMQDAL